LLQMTVRDGHMRDPAIGGSSWNLEVRLYWIFIVPTRPRLCRMGGALAG
jgi:hypothetical protein